MGSRDAGINPSQPGRPPSVLWPLSGMCFADSKVEVVVRGNVINVVVPNLRPLSWLVEMLTVYLATSPQGQMGERRL